MNSRSVLIFAFAVWASAVGARDEKSINDLRDALVALAPRNVDPREAELLSVTAHAADYTRDIGSRLKEFHFKTLVLHWGAAYAKESDENNGLVVTARNQPFLDGIVLDGWRKAGRLFWCPVKKDREYEIGRRNLLGQLGGHPHSGITAWKEDLQETAWLQEN